MLSQGFRNIQIDVPGSERQSPTLAISKKKKDSSAPIVRIVIESQQAAFNNGEAGLLGNKARKQGD